MVKGTMGVIACPMLEDELVFGIQDDPEPKNVYIVDGEYVRTIRGKLDRRSIPYTMVDEYGFMTGMDMDPDGFNIVIMMNPTKLHMEPEKLREHLKDQLRMLAGRFDVLALYYGMCGSYGWDPSAWAKENGIPTPVTVFHDNNGEVCDDCVSVAVGGREEYRDLVKNYTGMLFLTPAFATSWDEYPLGNEKEWAGFYSSAEEYMRDLFKWGHYEYALRIDTGLGDRERVDECCADVASRMELKLIDPSTPVATTALAHSMFERSKSLLGS